ncbi:hypothetical protein MHU86_9907 [Fragilaria crotonensis]|nr:hypothetical protein MHU86_9907 [Fragilaria crotonensis]
MADMTDDHSELENQSQSDILSDGSLSPTNKPEQSTLAASSSDVSEPQGMPVGDSQDTASENSDPIDPILDLLEFSEDVMCPDVSNILTRQLQGNNPTPVLLELARFFRAQACLLREQAKILDELAIRDTMPGQDEDLDDCLYRGRVTHLVKLSHDAMMATHDRIDALEDSVYPWSETCGKVEGKKLCKKRTRPVNRYTAFLHMNLKSCGAEGGSRQAIFKSLAAQWKTLDETEKSKYDEFAVAINREKAARKQSSKRAKLDEG